MSHPLPFWVVSQANNLGDHFCSDGGCSTIKDTTALYTNWSAISVSASHALAFPLADAILAQPRVEAAPLPQVAG